MSTKEKQHKPRAKKSKPNLHGPNSPTPKKRVAYDQVNDDEPIGSYYIRNDDSALDN
jgi:hypothetical protein